MKVTAFERKYEEIRAKASELHAQLDPLLRELKKVAKKALKLEELADNDPNLYVKDASGNAREDGWSIEILFRLGAFDFIPSTVESIDAALYNMKKTPFTIKEETKK